MPDMQSYLAKDGFENVCSYVNWAWTESIDLVNEIEAKTPLEKMHTTCQAAQAKVLDMYNNLEKNNMN
jgi:hypothetical protein